MNHLLWRWLTLTLAIMFASYAVDGIVVSGALSAFLAAAILGLLNTFFRPLLIILTLPINILTFGLFTFVINAILLMMSSGLIPGFYVTGFGPALLGSLMISAVNWMLTGLLRR